VTEERPVYARRKEQTLRPAATQKRGSHYLREGTALTKFPIVF